MEVDISRQTFVREKHYDDVLAQQGRVLLDSELNEMGAIRRYRTRVEAADVIGACGMPKEDVPQAQNTNFRIAVQGADNLVIGKGRYYVDGILCENEQEIAYDRQPDLPLPSGAPSVLQLLTGPNPAATFGLVYLDVWQRVVTALDDPRIRESALDGPDTTARLKTVWQVKVLPLPSANGTAPKCADSFPEWDALVKPDDGQMDAQIKPVTDPQNLCLPMPTTGFLGLENQLYRIEVHQGGTREEATFKWSRDNGSVVTAITQVSGNTLTVADLGRDTLLGFANDDWVEVSDDTLLLNGAESQPAPGAGKLVQIDSITPAKLEITLKTAPPALDTARNARLRRWDMPVASASASGIAMNQLDTDWVDLEENIQVQFKAGTYKVGDYWLVPARSAQGTIEWPPYQTPGTTSTMRHPEGVTHHFCPLALLEAGGSLTVKEDCRERFPTLTHICAEDVCFEDTTCKLGGVDNVQEALDRLCQERDLRFHNRHLHGWGIVCGLEVVCGPEEGEEPRHHATVRGGYALDCDGNDLELKTDVPLDIVQMIADADAANSGTPLLDGDGEVCLSMALDPEMQIQFALDKYDPAADSLSGLLKGSLLMDFFNDCLQPLTDFWKTETTPQPGEANLLVGPTQKRLTTLSNLVYQLVNPTNGQYIYFSQTEDQILRDLYTNLRTLLQSHTYCAMFDGARPFPDYPTANLSGPATAFGKSSFHTRVRAHPTQRRVYTVGAGNKIQVFDLDTAEMVAETEFPGGADAIVQDVALSKDGSQLYAAGVVNARDTVFATANITGNTYTWLPISTICDVQIVTLVTSPTIPNTVYGIGKGIGLFVMTPAAVQNTTTPKYAFNAVGHLAVAVISGMEFAFATRSSGTAVTNVYDSVEMINLTSSTVMQTVVLGVGAVVTGRDDIAVVVAPDATTAKLYVVIDPAGPPMKHLFIYDIIAAGYTMNAVIGGLENTRISLANNPQTGLLMLTFEDSYQVALLNDNKIQPGYRHPVQISPLSLAYVPGSPNSPELAKVAVLNYGSNTLTLIPAANVKPGVAPGNASDLAALSAYRTGVLNAYADLLGGLLQYLKDCFCDHLLVSCPKACDPNADKLYLACITIKSGQVFKVCNFARRRYVVSFPTLGYWMSLVPLVPMLREAVERFCCAALPDFFGKLQTPAPAPPPANTSNPARLQGQRLQQGVQFAQGLRFSEARSAVTSKVDVVRQIAGSWAGSTVQTNSAAARQAVVPQAAVIGQTTDVATGRLSDARVTVDSVQTFNPAEGTQHLLQVATAPLNLQPGTRVTLYAENGVVRYYAPVAPPPPEVVEMRAQIETQKQLGTEVSSLQTSLNDTRTQLAQKDQDITNLQNQVQAQLAQKDEQITALSTQLSTQLAQRDQQITALNTQLNTQLAQRDQQLSALTTQLQTLATSHAEITSTLTPERVQQLNQLPQLQADVAKLKT